MGSDNPAGAENQQERLINLGWVIGFVDGEGCFSIGFVRQHGGQGRSGYKTGIQVTHEFVVTQGARSVRCLEELEEFVSVGQVIVNRRHDDHREALYRYVVRRRRDLIDTIVPFFVQHPLRTAKRADFEKFALCLAMIEADHHLSAEGVADIAEVVQTMKPPKTQS